MIFIHSPRLTVLASGMLCFLAGLVADRYADEPGRVVWISLFIMILAIAAWMMNGLVRKLQPEPERKIVLRDAGTPQQPALETNSVCERVGLLKPTLRDQSKPRSFQTPPVLIQQSLDFDGMDALRALEEVSGQWLVCDASETAAEIIRTACLETVEGGETELERVGRWFDIAGCLRSQECQSLPKAELRRSFVAERVGVSKEQVRQIDQGRYAPLNRMLAELDPKSF